MSLVRRRGRTFSVASLAVAAATATALTVTGSTPGLAGEHPTRSTTATPIKHLVVIFQENVSFDHYFGTYPQAANTDGTPFTAKPGTPTVNGLTDALLQHNPNAANPPAPRPRRRRSPATRTTATPPSSRRPTTG